MIQLFRISDFFNRARVERSHDRIERAILDRARRIVIGVSVDTAFSAVSGVMVVARGRGHATTVQFADGVVQELPESLRINCLSVSNEESRSVEFSSCTSELAEAQASVVEQLKIKASKYVDRILAVSVMDPGWWKRDFDGTACYSSFCDASKLAERTGISVMDSWPSRDLSVGGSGKMLDPMAWWLLFADRNQRVARQVNVVISMGGETTMLLIPPSDGIDIESPRLSSFEVEGLDLINGLKQPPSAGAKKGSMKELLVTGFHDKRLIGQWTGVIGGVPERTRAFLQIVRKPEFRDLTTEQLLCTAMKWICDQSVAYVRQSLDGMKVDYARQRERLLERIESSPKFRVTKRGLLQAFDHSEPCYDRPGKIVLDVPPEIHDSLLSRLRNEFENVTISGVSEGECGIAVPDEAHIDKDSLIAAMMGFLHIDQIPGNLLQFTGASQQRILGRLTPGRPNSWRNLLKEMADYEPPTIKLRDAV